MHLHCNIGIIDLCANYRNGIHHKYEIQVIKSIKHMRGEQRMRNTTLLRPLLALLFALTLISTAQAQETENPITIKSMTALNAAGSPQLLFEDGDSIRFSAQIETASDKPMLLFGRTTATGVEGFKGKTFLVVYPWL